MPLTKPKKNLYSQIHGKLVVVDLETDRKKIEPFNPKGYRGFFWLCLCECGNFTYARTNDLIFGRKRSCGCANKKNRKVLDLLGQKFGWLTPIQRAHDSTGKSGWLCQCDCGNTTIVRTTNLKNGNSTSCGCKRKTRHKRTSKRCLT